MAGESLGEEEMARIVEMLRAIGHEGRLALIDALRVRGELSVSELEQMTGIVQPGLSQQLAVLRKPGLVSTRRVAKQVYYSLVPEAFQLIAGYLTALAGTQAAPAPPASTRARGSAAMFAKIL